MKKLARKIECFFKGHQWSGRHHLTGTSYKYCCRCGKVKWS